ncbi:MAG: glycoside hydrolase family 20 zincin-like fold domain-containing protein [Chthonomonadales bacterium]
MLGVLRAGVLAALASVLLTARASAMDEAGLLAAGFAGGSLKASFDRIPVIRGSLLQVFTQDASRGYSSNSDPPVVTRKELPGGRYLLTAQFGRATEGRFAATEYVEVDPAGLLTIRLNALWKGDRPVHAEWAAAMIWAYPLWNAQWQADFPDGTRTNGRINQVPQPNPPLGQILAQGFADLAVHARAFDLRVQPGEGFPEVLLLDGRSNTAPWAQGDRLFWLGSIHTRLDPGVAVSRTLTLRFTRSAGRPAVGPVLRVPASWRKLPPPPPPSWPPLLIPQPKQVRFTGDVFRLMPGSSVALLTKDARLMSAARELLGSLGRIRFTGSAWKGRGILLVDARELPSRPDIQAFLGKQGWLPPDHAEGYCLYVDGACAAIVGADAAGAFYGLQTLRQLVRRRGAGAEIAGCDIEDWPSLPFRGAHLFTGVKALSFHKKLIRNIFSRFKLNSLVLECEYTRWRTHPEIAVTFAMSKKDLAEDVAFARSHFLQPIPLIQSLGHSEWAFRNGQHLDLAEDRAHPSALCPNNPSTYRLVLDVYGEALQLFHPAYFHIGHDEVGMFGRFPAHPWCLAQGRDTVDAASNLFAEDVARLNGWLRARGVRTMLWGDMLLSRSEISDAAANAPTPQVAAKRRAALPRDVVIADWHYNALPPERFPSVTLFHNEGLPVIASTWYDPGNIYGFARAAVQQGALGLLQTTWAGFDSREAVLKQEFRQFSAFILAAEYAWSGIALKPDQLPYRPEEVFKDAWENAALPPIGQAEWALDLNGAFNDVDTRLSGLASGIRTCRHRQFQVVCRDGGTAVIRLAGRLNSSLHAWPNEVVLQVNAKAREVDFLHGCTFPAAGTVAAEYRVMYTDGRSIEVPVVYGDAVAALDDLRPAWNSDRVCRVSGAAGQSYALRLFRWKNPRPAAPIKEISLKAVDPVAAPLIAAVTCVR